MRSEDLYPEFESLEHLRWWAGYDSMKDLLIAADLKDRQALTGSRMLYRGGRGESRDPEKCEVARVAEACGVPVYAVMDASIKTYEEYIKNGGNSRMKSSETPEQIRDSVRADAWLRRIQEHRRKRKKKG